MARNPRPSDVYRLPEEAPRPTSARAGGATGATAEGSARGPSGPQRWALRVALLGVVLLLGGLGLRTSPAPGPRPEPLVDVDVEDTAVAVLALAGAEAAAIDDLRQRTELYVGRGPGAASAAVAEHRAAIAAALAAARERPAVPAAAAYWGAREHDLLAAQLGHLEALAADIALLAAVHDTLFGGAGAIPLAEGQQRLTSRFVGTGAAPPLAGWADALLRSYDGAATAQEALAARDAAAALWATRATALTLPAQPALAAYLATVPPATLEALRGHPVAGAALARVAP